jgi:transcriptional regulator with XRE-family HTH domain
MSQAQLAEQAGLASRSHIVNLESGRDVPSLLVVFASRAYISDLESGRKLPSIDVVV